MFKGKCRVSVSEEVWVETDIDLDAEEVFRGMDDEAKGEMAQLLGFPGYLPEADSIVEAAFSVVRRMDDCPKELKDLFWLVHERAMP
jgi:hypothetical protein